MTPRRDFLRTAALLAAGRSLSAQSRTRLHLGCQTNAWAINPLDFSNLLAVLDKIKRYGYEGFETGFANVQGQFAHAAEAKARIDATGLKFFGVHIFLTKYDPETNVAPADRYEPVVAGGARLGAQRLILSGTPPAGPAALKKKAEGLNRAAEFAAKRGLKFAYHNHGPEFANQGAEIEYLIPETDPSRVEFLLDAGHAFHGGADVPAFIRKHHRRLAGMHLRDFKNGDQVPLGGGEFPLREVAQAIRDTGWSGWLLNEEERLTSKPGDAAVEPARDALFRVFGGSV